MLINSLKLIMGCKTGLSRVVHANVGSAAVRAASVCTFASNVTAQTNKCP